MIQKLTTALGRLDPRSGSLYHKWAEFMQMSPMERKYIEKVVMCKDFLELGSGYSTLWFSQYAFRIVSVETRREWFQTIRNLLDRHRITNVELHLLEPESCAYYANGREKWNNRETPDGSDYGTSEEFTGYLRGVENLLDTNGFDVVLVDGNIRDKIIECMRDRNYSTRVLLHDVMPEREYLNNRILTMDGIRIVNKVDTLVELTMHPTNDRLLP